MIPHNGGTVKHSDGISSWTSLCHHFTAIFTALYQIITQTQTPSITAAGSGSQWQGMRMPSSFISINVCTATKVWIPPEISLWDLTCLLVIQIWIIKFANFAWHLATGTASPCCLSSFSPFWSFYWHHLHFLQQVRRKKYMWQNLNIKYNVNISTEEKN